MPDTDIRRGLLLAEDEALKAKLSGITVPSANGPVRVKTWFRFPEREREITYPFLTIELLDIAFAADRAHSAQITEVDYWPSEYPTIAEKITADGGDFDNALQSAKAVWWHPYDLLYQITTYTRSSQQDRALTATLLGTAYLPDRWGYLHVPADGTERHLDRTGMSSNDFLEPVGETTMRTFSKTYNVTVTADLPPENLLVYRRVIELHGLIHDIQDTSVSATWVNPDPTP